MEPKKENLNKPKLNGEKVNHPVDKIYIKKEHKSRECNCPCCKYCNDFWRPYKPNLTSLNTKVKRIKFKKNFYCNRNCLNCKKYIYKKEQQWQEYMISFGLEFDEETNLELSILPFIFLEENVFFKKLSSDNKKIYI